MPFQLQCQKSTRSCNKMLTCSPCYLTFSLRSIASRRATSVCAISSKVPGKELTRGGKSMKKTDTKSWGQVD